jgi:4-amino-4-deoxy-L-arabinose transferase-like glycosyltransferase
VRALRNRQRSGDGRLSFRARLAGVVAVGVALRLVHVLAIAPSTAIFTDGYFFHWVGKALAEGHGYVDPTQLFFRGHSVATAAHPPLYTLVIAAATKLGITGDEAQRSLGCLFGAGTIALVGLLGRRAAGETVGVLAAAIAACYPLLIAADGALMSETLYGLLIALVLLLAYRLRDEATVWRAVGLGAVIGLAALTRAEALLLLVLLIPAVRSLRLWAVACLAALVVLAPWTVRNWTTFDRPVLISTNDGVTLAGSNCGATYHGRDLGSFTTSCIQPARPGDNEAQQAAAYRSEAESYAGDHAGRVPVVAAVRVLRLWGLYQPTRLAYDAQNRRLAVQEAGVLFSYLLIPLAAFGAVLLRRRREPLSILLAPILLVTITCALTYGGLRLRQAAEIPLVVLAAVGAVALWQRRRGRRPRHAPSLSPVDPRETDAGL